MWPFDKEEEEETQDESVAEFDAITSYIFEEAADPDEALGALRDIYSEFEFSDQGKANNLLEERSRLVREKFGIKNQFDYDSTLEYAPINFDDVIGEGDTDQGRTVDQINKWEAENKKFISESSDPIYIQNKTRLLRDIEKVGVAQRRQIYGSDNYLVTDQALRVAQGAVGPLASLAGADAVNDWFTENTDPDGATIFGNKVGGDDSYVSAISSGVGSLGGALGAGVLTGGVGATAYLAASGAGSVRQQYEDSREAGASVDEATDAALIESASQIGQTLVGGRIVGDTVARIGGKAVTQLGTRVFPRVAGSAVLEGTTEAIGQGVSNIATNTGQGTDLAFTEGMDKAFVGGFAAGGAVSGAGAFVEGRRAKTAEVGIDTATVPVTDGEAVITDINPEADPLATEALQAQELNNVIEEQEMQTPPPYESVRAKSTMVELSEVDVVAEREDGTRIVDAGGNLHNDYNPQTNQYEEAYQDIVSVAPEVAAKLKELEVSAAPDGTGFDLFVEDGSLYIRSEFIPEDFATAETPITTDKTGMKKVKVASTPGIQPGQVDVQANPLSIKDGAVQAKFRIGSAPVKTTAGGAAGADFINRGRKESAWAKKFRNTLTPEQAEAFELSITSFEDLGKGEIKEVQIPLHTRIPNINKEQGIEARRFLSEKGYVGALAYFDNLGDSASVQDNANAAVLLGELKRAQEQAANEGNYELEDAYTPLVAAAAKANTKLKEIAGGSLQLATNQAQIALGGIPLEVVETVSKFKRKARKDAEVEAAKELGVKEVPLGKLKRDARVADEQVAAIEAEIGDPVEIAKADIDAKIAEVKENSFKKEVTEPIKKYEEDIQELKNREEAAKLDVNNQLSEAGKAVKEQIAATEEALAKVEAEVTEVSNETLEPTKQQVVKKRAIAEKIKDLTKQKEKIEKALADEKDTYFGSKVKPEVAEKRKAKANQVIADLNGRLEDATAKQAEIDSEIEERTSQTRKPTSEATKKMNALRSKLTDLNNQFKSTEKLDPKKSAKVQELRSLTAERKRAIRHLKKQKTPTLSEAEQKKIANLEAKKAEIDTAEKEGRIKVSIEPEVKARLDIAKQTQLKVKKHLTAVEQKRQKNLEKFTAEDQETLKQLYGAKEGATTPTEQMELDAAIVKLRSKIEPITPDAVDSLYQYWRGNILSGAETLLRNLGSFLSIAGSTASYAATDAQRLVKGERTKVAEFAKGALKGFKDSITSDALEILMGNRYGKLAMDPSENINREVAKLKWMPISKVANIPVPNPLLPLLSIVETSRRLMSTIDTVASTTARNGHARVAALMAAEKGLSKTEQIAAVEDAMFETADKREKVRIAIEERVKALDSVGIKTTPRQQRIMFNEAMELNRSEKLQAIGDAGGKRATYMNTPDGMLGGIAKALNIATGYTMEIGGKKIQPFRQLMPFVNTAANIGNEMMTYSPIGFVDAGKSAMKSKKAKQKALLDAIKESETNVEKGLAALPQEEMDARVDAADLYQTEMTEFFGRAMVGSAFMVGMAGVLAAFEDDEKPWIKFNGQMPPGEARAWQAQNRKPFSLEIGGTVITKDLLGPLTFGLAAADIINKARKSNQNEARTAFILSTAMVGILSNLSFLKNAGELFSAFNGSEPIDDLFNKSEKSWMATGNVVKGAGASYAQGLIPASGFLRNLYKWTDGASTETYNNFQAKLLSNIPFGKEVTGAEDRLNEFGEPIKGTPWQRNPLGIFVTTLNDSPINSWKVETGYTTTQQAPIIKLNKGEVEDFGVLRGRRLGDEYRDLMNEEESARVLKVSGPQIKQYLSQISKLPSFQVYNEDNQKEINKEIARIRAEAREVVLSTR